LEAGEEWFLDYDGWITGFVRDVLMEKDKDSILWTLYSMEDVTEWIKCGLFEPILWKENCNHPDGINIPKELEFLKSKKS